VADIVAAGLGAARAAIAAGWARVEGYVQGLDPAVQEIGREAQKRVEDDFRGMVDAIEEKRDALLDGLAQSYRSSQERLNERIEELWADSRSLWEKAKALIRRVIQTLRRLKDLLFSVLRRLVEVVAAILQDPIGFLGNLVRGVGAGLSRFRARILDHLREGVLRWLFGALQGAGVQLPQQFDAKGIFGLILQLLQLTYAGIRARAVRLLGEPVVARLEQVAEFFRVLATEGPAGLWRMLQEKVEAIKETVLGQIREFVAERIVRAGIEWILGLLTPVGAFIKACQGIYRIVMFFVERGQQLVELVEAVLGALGAIIGGNLAAMANAVENALVRALPVAIGLLASLIGLGGISERIRTIFQRVRAPVERAIDWLVGQAARLLGRGRQEPTRAAPEGSQALKAEVVATLERELGGEQKAEDAQRIVASIERRYRPSGLRRLFVGPPRDDGSAPVIAETSPGDEVAALTLGGAVKGHKPSVRANIELTLRAPPGAGGAGLPMQTTGATTHPVGTLPEIGRHGRGEASQAAYFLPAVSETAESRTPGNLAVGGIVLPSSGTRIHVVTFSTSSLDLEKRENESHAERQFERWLETLARDPNGSLLLANIKKIEIHLREYSPCGMCTDSLVRIRKMLPNAEVAELYWYKLYTGASPTSWQSLRAIQNARWRLHAPPSAMPPEKSSWGNVFVYLVSKVRGRRR
ncbi:MAG TPA: hypothetical protein VFG43_02985, partial [Geminicoccaceae bacterium]|nr:hypothetical protein [Geminicoccaceae bacterium]